MNQEWIWTGIDGNFWRTGWPTANWSDMRDWCNENCGKLNEDWTFQDQPGRGFAFASEQDATLFLLRWA
jgi:hypothetical protein